MTPTIGRIVIYTPTNTDEPHNYAHELPAVVVRALDDNDGIVNLKVLNDGNVDFWRTSVKQGTGQPGTWNWPARQETK